MLVYANPKAPAAAVWAAESPPRGHVLMVRKRPQHTKTPNGGHVMSPIDLVFPSLSVTVKTSFNGRCWLF